MILGTVLIAAVILISGSAVAPWVTTVISSSYCTNINKITGASDDDHATLGETGIPPLLDQKGTARLDLGSGNGMPADQDFTVFADFGGETEYYDVFVGEDLDNLTLVGEDQDDQRDHDFTTPLFGSSWRYIILVGKSGDVDEMYDPDYGPEIDAVGWI